MSDILDSQDEITTEALLHDLKVIREKRCRNCGRVICGHEALMSLTMGFKNAPRCWNCLADALGHGKEALRDRMASFIASRECYSEGWLWANQAEGFGPGDPPRCLWPEQSIVQEDPPSELESGEDNAIPLTVMNGDCNAEWDAGNMACGELVFELRMKIQALRKGQIFKVRATDAGAEKDLPSWCRMTGNTLLASQHPIYLIRKK